VVQETFLHFDSTELGSSDMHIHLFRVTTAIEKLNSRTFLCHFPGLISTRLRIDFQYHSFIYLFFVLIIKESSFTILSR